jgi:RodZ C-terminal domain
VLLVLGLVAANVVIWGGYVRIPLVSPDPASPSPRPATSTAPTSARVSTSTHRAVTAPPTTTIGPPASTQAQMAPAVVPVRFRITAARGDSWVLIRRSGPTGAIVYSGILSQGRSVTVKGTRFWVRFGAVGNLDLVLNGKAVRPAHTGTIDAVVTPSGLSS